MSMSNKSDCLQKGELVKFQTCTIPQTGQKMACNVVPQRRAVVECVKDQVGLVFVFTPSSVSGDTSCLVTTAWVLNGLWLNFLCICAPPTPTQFGFITYEVGDSKKLFFHVKEVQDGLELQTGDEVEFSVVLNQRTGKCSACNVRRVR